MAQERRGHDDRVAAARLVRRQRRTASRRRSPRRFTNAVRKKLVDELAPLRKNAAPESSWRDWGGGATVAANAGRGKPVARGKDLSWEPLRPREWSKFPTTTCRALDSGTAHSSFDGVLTSDRRNAVRSVGGHAAYELERVFGVNPRPGVVVRIGRFLRGTFVPPEHDAG